LKHCREWKSKKPAHYDPEGSKPHEFLQLVGTLGAPHMHAIAQNSDTSSPLLLLPSSKREKGNKKTYKVV